MANLADLMVESARTRGGEPALRLGETVVTYDDWPTPAPGWQGC